MSPGKHNESTDKPKDERQSRSPRKQPSPTKVSEAPRSPAKYEEELTLTGDEQTKEDQPVKLELEEFTKLKEPISVFKNRIINIIETEDKST